MDMQTISVYCNRIESRVKVVFLIFLFITLFCSTAFGKDSSGSEDTNFIQGYDVVSYFRDTGPLEGSSQYSTVYQQHTLLFNSEKNLMDFKSDPASFMPAYNGYCAYGMVFGMKSKVDPLQYDIVDGQLYLQLDGGTKKRFNRRLGRNIKKSKRAWNKLIASGSNE